jgi:hypothetical protein
MYVIVKDPTAGPKRGIDEDSWRAEEQQPTSDGEEIWRSSHSAHAGIKRLDHRYPFLPLYRIRRLRLPLCRGTGEKTALDG